MLLHAITRGYPLEFAIAGLFDEPGARVFADTEEVGSQATYLVFEAGQRLKVRAVPQRAGGVKYAVDQLENPATITLSTGDRPVADRLIAGRIATASADPVSRRLMTLFARELRTRFHRIKSYSVGPEAMRMLDAGARLSSLEKSPPEYDLER